MHKTFTLWLIGLITLSAAQSEITHAAAEQAATPLQAVASPPAPAQPQDAEKAAIDEILQKSIAVSTTVKDHAKNIDDYLKRLQADLKQEKDADKQKALKEKISSTASLASRFKKLDKVFSNAQKTAERLLKGTDSTEKKSKKEKKKKKKSDKAAADK